MTALTKTRPMDQIVPDLPTVCLAPSKSEQRRLWASALPLGKPTPKRTHIGAIECAARLGGRLPERQSRGKFFPGFSSALGTSRYHKTFTFLTLPRPNPSIDCLSSVPPRRTSESKHTDPMAAVSRPVLAARPADPRGIRDRREFALEASQAAGSLEGSFRITAAPDRQARTRIQ